MAGARYSSGDASIQIDQHVPGAAGRHPALVVLHGSGGAAHYWMERFGPALRDAGVALFAPHYFDKMAIERGRPSVALDERHFTAWLAAIRDAVTHVAVQPFVNRECIGVLGISLGAFLAVALGIEDARVRAVVELSGGVPRGWETRMSPRMPPTLILHGELDDVVPVSEAFKLQGLLREHGVEHEMELFVNQGHWFQAVAQAEILMRCASFLSHHLLVPDGLQRAG